MWPRLPHIDQACAPIHGQTTGPHEAAMGIIAAGHERAWKRQSITHDGAPTEQGMLHLWTFHITRGHQQSAAHALGVLGMRGPCSHQDAAQAVGDQHHLFMGQYGFFELRHPVTAQGIRPVMLGHAGVAMLRLPQALPMIWPAVVPAGQKKDCRHGGDRLTAFERARPSLAQTRQRLDCLSPRGQTRPRANHSWAPRPGGHCAE